VRNSPGGGEDRIYPVVIRNSDASTLRPVKRGVFHIFLFLYHTNNPFKNVNIFYFPFFNSLEKNFNVKNM
jgi:hypothetical protein